MVIRGRRVNRCDTCTRRKVKCDETRPHCERCKKSGLQCEGYSLNLVIVGPKDARSAAPGKLAVWSPQTTDANAHREPPQTRRPRPIRPKPQPQIRSLLPSQDTILAAHILSRFSPPRDVEASAPATLLPQLIQMDKSYSAQALSAIYFGKMRNQYQIYQRGTQLYIRALDQLRKAINDPEKARQNETLTSVLCLCLYEHVVLSETTAWLKHYQGVGRLVEYRGPECHQTEFEKDVFRICRFMIILSAGVTKSHCFLAEERWKTARSRPSHEHQAAIDRLYDIMAEVPGLFHDMDYLDHLDKHHGSGSYLALREQAGRLLSELYDWPRAVMQSSDINDANGSVDSNFSDSNMVLPPKNQAVAAALAICYATILSLATATDYFELPLHLPSSREATSRTNSDASACDPTHKAHVRRTLACEICHLATATLRGEQSTSTAFFFIFSLQVAHQHLRPDTPEGMRLEGLLDSVIAEKHGFETGRTREWAAFFNSPPTL